MTVLCSVDSRTVCTDDLYTKVIERLRQVDGGLSAKRCDNALRLLKLDDIHNVLCSKRLEIKLVCGGIVGGNGLGVIVDDNSLVARIFNSRNRVNGGIVKLNTLTDTDRTCTENDDLLLVGEAGGVFTCVGGVEVRNVCSCVAGVYHTEGREKTLFLSEVKYASLITIPKLSNVLVGEAHLLCLGKCIKVEALALKGVLHLNDVLDCLKEEGGNLSHFVKLLYTLTAAEELGNSKDIVIAEFLDVGEHLLACHSVKLLVVEVVYTDLKRANALKERLLKRGADAHNLTCGLHLCAKAVGRGGKLIEGESGKLRDNVVKTRLECRVGVGNADLLKSHTYGNLGSNARDRIAGCLGCKSRASGYSGVNLDKIIFARFGV